MIPASDAVTDRAPLEQRARQVNVATGVGMAAGETLEELGSAGTHQPVDAHDLAGLQRERDVVDGVAAVSEQAQVLDAQQRLADRRRLFGEHLGRVLADHLLDDPGHVDDSGA